MNEATKAIAAPVAYILNGMGRVYILPKAHAATVVENRTENKARIAATTDPIRLFMRIRFSFGFAGNFQNTQLLIGLAQLVLESACRRGFKLQRGASCRR